MTYDEAIKLTDLQKKLNILCDKFDKAKNLKKIIKKMSYGQLLIGLALIGIAIVILGTKIIVEWL